MAIARQAVINAEIRNRQSKLLDQELEDDFKLREESLSESIFPNYAENNLSEIIRSPKQLRQFTQFLILEADSLNPAFNRLGARVDANDRQHKLNKRRFYSPTLSFQGQLDNSLWQGGAGAEPINGGAQPSLPLTDDWTWSLALNISFPIIDQGQRIIDLQRTSIQQRQLSIQKRDLNQNIELGIRTLVLDLVSASTNVTNSRIPSKNTKKIRGGARRLSKRVVPINQLINAQDAAFNARQNFENSVYNYLLTFLQLENTLGRYSILSSKVENQAFINRYLQFSSHTLDDSHDLPGTASSLVWRWYRVGPHGYQYYLRLAVCHYTYTLICPCDVQRAL